MSYLRIRRVAALVVAALCLGALAAVLGEWVAPVPTADGTAEAQPRLWLFLALGAGTLPVFGLHSPMEALEHLPSSRFHRMQWRTMWCVAAGCWGAFLLAAATALPSETVALMARALPAWAGLALLAGRLGSWRTAWIGPLAVLVPLIYWGTPGSGGEFPWWEFTARPVDDLPALLLSLAVGAVGVVALAATPWRVHTVLKACRRLVPGR